LEYIIAIATLGFLYLFIRPKIEKTVRKTKVQKQEEIFDEYKLAMNKELFVLVDNKSLYKQKKIALLKRFANELNKNVFFETEDTKKLIQRLIDGK